MTLKNAILTLLLAVMTFAPVLAQPATPAASAETEVRKEKVKELTHNAEYLRSKLNELLVVMTSVATQLEKSEPDVAKIIRQTVAQAHNMDVNAKMADVIASLRGGLDEAALKSQTEVVGALKNLLHTLEGGVTNKSDTTQRREQLEKVRAEVDKVYKEQLELEKTTRPNSNAKDIDAATAALVAGIKAAMKEQKEIAAASAKLPAASSVLQQLAAIRESVRVSLGSQNILYNQAMNAALAKLPILAVAQKRIQAGCAPIQTTIEATAKDPAVAKALAAAGADEKLLTRCGGLLKSATGEMARSTKALARSNQSDAQRPQEQAIADLKDIEKFLSDAIAKLAAKTPAGDAAKKQGDLAKKTGELDKKFDEIAKTAGMDPENLPGDPKSGEKAQEAMNKAAEKIESGQAPQAAGEQKKAEEKLGEMLKKAEELRKEAMKKAAAKPDAEKQADVAKKAEAVAKAMEKDINGKPMPGQESMAKAKDAAAKAGEEMKAGESKAGNQKQKEAAKEMEKARAELDAKIDELREQEKKEQLAKIHEQLELILEQQRRVSEKTIITHGRRKEGATPYGREDIQTLANMASIEGTLGEKVAGILVLLAEEGSTVVFPDVLKDVQDDLMEVKKQLAGHRAGPVIQATQADIEATLEELIGAVRDVLSKGPGRKEGGGGGEGEGEGEGEKPPLIPPLAELRMLNLKQKRIMRQTAANEALMKAGHISKADADSKGAKLAKQQSSLVDMINKLKEIYTQQQEEQQDQ